MRPNATHGGAPEAVIRNATVGIKSLKSLQSLKALKHLKSLQKLQSSAPIYEWDTLALVAVVLGVLIVIGCCLCRSCAARGRLRATHAAGLGGSDRPLLVRGNGSMGGNLVLANLSSLGHGPQQPGYEPLR
jgi:hypothetical protein